MTRRKFTSAASGLAMTGRLAAQPSKRSIIELRYLRMRYSSENQMKRTSDFLANGALPALKKAGIGPLGFFSAAIAPDSPFILALATFPSLAAMESMREKEAQDAEYQNRVLGDRSKIVAIEAGRSTGWYHYVNHDALVIGIDRFGASAPYEQIAEHLGFTPEAVAAKVREWRKA